MNITRTRLKGEEGKREIDKKKITDNKGLKFCCWERRRG